jgi:predicted PurR-regulated permease PerM
VVERIGYTLGWWLIGIFFNMGMVDLLTGVGLWLLNVPLALILGIIADGPEKLA